MVCCNNTTLYCCYFKLHCLIIVSAPRTFFLGWGGVGGKKFPHVFIRIVLPWRIFF